MSHPAPSLATRVFELDVQESAHNPLSCLCLSQSLLALHARNSSDTCPRPLPGSVVAEPADLHSHNGVLKVELTVHNTRAKRGSTRYCYLDNSRTESPTLRVNPGDLVILTLKNDLTAFSPDAVPPTHQHMHMDTEKAQTPVPAT